jgi:hypothetical protein
MADECRRFTIHRRYRPIDPNYRAFKERVAHFDAKDKARRLKPKEKKTTSQKAVMAIRKCKL